MEFDHDSSNSEPQYSVIATVGEGDAAESSEPQPATITFFVINDAPIFTTNVLSITEGGTVVLNADAPNLVTTDEAGESTPDRKSTRLNSSHSQQSRMPSSA